jgi:peptidase E
MSKYYLLSDFSQETGFSLLTNDFKRDLKSYKLIVFIASNPIIGDITDKYAARYLEWFEKIGIIFEKSMVLDSRMDMKYMHIAIQNASLIYLMGGTTPLQMEFLLNNHLIEPICKADCLVMGLSAGAINMGKTSILTKTCGHDKQEVYNGIGLVDLSVEPHFSPSEFNDELKQLSTKYKIYALCDESAIIIRENKISYYGDIYLLKDGSFIKISD